MSETARVDLPVVRDWDGDVCCRDEDGEECIALRRIGVHDGAIVRCDLGCGVVREDSRRPTIGGAFTYRPEQRCQCPISVALYAEGRS